MRSGRPPVRHRTAPDGVPLLTAAGVPRAESWLLDAASAGGLPQRRTAAVHRETRREPAGRPELSGRGFLVAAVVAGLGVLTFCALSAGGLLGERQALVLDNAGQIAAGLAAAMAGIWTALRARRPDRAWRLLLGLGAAGWTAGVCVWAWFQIVVGDDLPSPSLADVGFFTLPLFALPALYLFPAHERDDLPERPEQRPWLRLVHVLDSLIVVGSLFVLTWATALGAALQSAPPSQTPQFLVALGYPVTDLLLVVFVVLLGSLRSPRNPLALLLLGLGLIGVSVSDSFYLYLVSTGAERMPALYNIGFVLGPALIALSLVAPNPRAHSRRPGRQGGGRPAVLLPYVPLVVTGTVLVVQLVRDGRDSVDAVEGTAALLLIVLVIARQLVTLVDNANLLHQVRDGQQRLQRQAYFDSLTGLANRVLFRDRLDRAVAAHRTEGRALALMFCDLDDFKFVNDRHGHAAGDELLQAVADRLRRCVRPGDTVARLGGDEFAVLLEGGGDAPEAVARRVLGSLEQPYGLSGPYSLAAGETVAVTAGASIGLVLLDADDAPIAPDTLLATVDAAMYAAKRRGKNRLVVFHGDVVGGDEPQGMLGELRMAIMASAPNGVRAGSSGRIEVMYQPIVRFRTGQVVAVEALVRWQHPRHGTLPAEVLVSAADDAGMLPALEELVLDTACRDLRLLRSEAAMRSLVVHVNVSASRTGDPRLPGVVAETLERHRLPGDALVVEITETSRVPDLETAAAVLGKISELGVRLALDDFGTGYSGLSYLLELPIDIVKLDRSLTVAEAAGRGGTIRHAAAALTLGLGLDLIAEGVETPAQAQLVAGIGCELGQGYLWARPHFLSELDLSVGRASPDVDRTVSPIHAASRRVSG